MQCSNNTPTRVQLPYNAIMADTDSIEQPYAALVRSLEERNGRLQQALQGAEREIDALTYSCARSDENLGGQWTTHGDHTRN